MYLLGEFLVSTGCSPLETMQGPTSQSSSWNPCTGGHHVAVEGYRSFSSDYEITGLNPLIICMTKMFSEANTGHFTIACTEWTHKECTYNWEFDPNCYHCHVWLKGLALWQQNGFNKRAFLIFYPVRDRYWNQAISCIFNSDYQVILLSFMTHMTFSVWARPPFRTRPLTVLPSMYWHGFGT